MTLATPPKRGKVQLVGGPLDGREMLATKLAGRQLMLFSDAVIQGSGESDFTVDENGVTVFAFHVYLLRRPRFLEYFGKRRIEDWNAAA